jgi:hypothetical protein
MTSTTTTGLPHRPYQQGTREERVFKHLADIVQRSISRALTDPGTKLYSVSTEGLFDHYLESFDDPVERQQHNCNCCRHFIKKYGGLMVLSPNGDGWSAVWDRAQPNHGLPMVYVNVLNRMKALVEARTVETRFFWDHQVWGIEMYDGWSHFAANVHRLDSGAPLLTDNQIMAASREDRKHLERAAEEMKSIDVDHALAMLKAGGLERAENLVPMGNFLQEVQKSLVHPRGERRNRVLWFHVGRAASGWCTPRGSAFGALVEDIAAGKGVHEITRSHNAKMDPLQYQRPQAPPAAGNVKQAEAIVEKLGLASALRRRPMALEEAQVFWQPTPVATKAVGGGVFGHLQTKGSVPPVKGPLASKVGPMTWAKFQRDILPSARRLRLLVPSHGNFSAITTAVDPSAPPILKWDAVDKRNPGAWYVYASGSMSTQWNLRSHERTDILALTKLPPEWNGGSMHTYQTGGRVLLILKGAKDLGQPSLCLFPECVRSDLHSVRSTIEAHSKSKKMEDETRQRASGFLLHDKMKPIAIEVTTDMGTADYTIDRLE